jgi:hypothetical protein
MIERVFFVCLFVVLHTAVLTNGAVERAEEKKETGEKRNVAREKYELSKRCESHLSQSIIFTSS